MAKIEGIRIQNFRGLKDVSMGRSSKNPDAEPLSPLSMVIGKNGVGKSTLFDAFGFLADALRDGVEKACDNRGGFEKIRSQGKKTAILLEITYREHENIDPIRYFFQIKIDKNNRPYVLTEILIQLAKEPFFLLFLFQGVGLVGTDVTKGLGHEDSKKLTKIYEQKLNNIEKTQNNMAPLEFWAQVIEDTNPKQSELLSIDDFRRLGISVFGALKQHPEIAAFRQFLESWYLSYFTPDAARNVNTISAQPHLNSKGDNIANVVEFLENNHKEKFQEILNSIAEKIPGIHTIKTYRDPINKNLYLLFNEKGFSEPFYQLQMSDGTLKVFAYLLLLDAPNPPPFICIEEPENGLYHKLLEVLAAEFRTHTQRENGSQLFITTHQPYFVDALDPDEVWVLEKGEDGFSTITRASEIPYVQNMVNEGQTLGTLWYSDYLDAR